MRLPFPLVVPPGKILVAYGGGVNTVATLVVLRRAGIVPAAIVMADPGSERRRTIVYRDNTMGPWLASIGFPPVTVVSRKEEARYRPRTERFETLKEECDRLQSLPSIAYGLKRCSLKFKRDPSLWWTARQPWVQEEWAAGRRIVKAIGYDVDEGRRVMPEFGDAWERARFVPTYPLHFLGIDREGCEEIIRSEGLPPARKSACSFCASNTIEDWEDLRREEPDAFVEAVEMNRRAHIEEPRVVGLLRANPEGKRQLHVWSEGGYGDCSGGREDDMPCECAT